MEYELSITESDYHTVIDHINCKSGATKISLLQCGVMASKYRKRLLVRNIFNCTYIDIMHIENIIGDTIRLPQKVGEFVVVLSKYPSKKLTNLLLTNHITGVLTVLEDGEMTGRIVDANKAVTLTKINIVGDKITFFRNVSENVREAEGYAQRHIQLFGKGTYDRLKSLTIAVVGCSGTGSPVAEQLARLGVGKLILIDPDYIEDKNINRILNSTKRHALNKISKVIMLKKAIKTFGLGTKVDAYDKELSNQNVVSAVANSDVIFGCMDSVDGRHLLNRLATFYLLPYFDIGVKLIADGDGGIEQACGSVHYLKPGGSSLLSRKVYTYDQLYAANLKRTDINEYKERLKSKYIVGVDEDRPAVISVNMFFAALAVNEFLARIHPFRDDDNSEYAVTRFSFTQGIFYKDADGPPCEALLKHVGKGDVVPLLGLPQLSGVD